MPVIVELRLHPERWTEPTTRQLHGLACALFESGGPGHGRQEKPFTVWPLRAVSGGSAVSGGAVPGGAGDWLLRGAWLPEGFPQGVLTSLGTVRLGPVNCAVTDVTFRQVTHGELAS